MTWRTDRPCPPADSHFWAKVDKTGECWIWTGVLKGGYGQVRRRRYDPNGLGNFQAHRISYEDAYGRIPPGLVVDHICRNTACVRPEHLQVVTQITNIHRGVSWSAVNASKMECPAGHPYDESNTYIVPSTGGRMCRTCKARGRADERARRRARAAEGQGPGRPGRRPVNTPSE